jgi:hypothetical protein
VLAVLQLDLMRHALDGCDLMFIKMGDEQAASQITGH